MQRRNQVFFRKRARVEKFLHQCIVAFGNHLDQLFVRGLGDVFHVGGNFGLFPLAVSTQIVRVRLHADEIHHAR